MNRFKNCFIGKSSVRGSLICMFKIFSKSTSFKVLYAGHFKKIERSPQLVSHISNCQTSPYKDH